MRGHDRPPTKRLRLMRRLGSKLGLALALAVVLVLGPPTAGRAQLRDLAERAERVRTELERTDGLLRRVAEQVREADVPKAREYVQMAAQVQTRARQLFTGLREDSFTSATAETQLRQVLGLTLRARDMAQQAGKQLHELAGLEERSRRTIERAAETLDRLRGAFADSGDARAAELLAQARRKLELAQQQYRDGNYEISLNLAESALRLLETLESSGRDELADRLREELARTRDFLERARQQLRSDEGTASQRLSRAEQLLEQATESAAAGRLLVARRQLERCQTLLRDLVADLGEVVDEGDVRRGIERLTQELRRLREEMGGDLRASERRLLDEAVRERDRAERALGAEDTERAVRHLRAANDLLARLQRRLEDPRS